MCFRFSQRDSHSRRLDFHRLRNEKGISVSVKKTENDAVFTVCDNGEGIRDDALPHLFDGYLADYKEKETDVRRNMSIGLSVCMSIIKVHGGTITAKNRPGGGAEFRFSLPFSEE